jgi:predicted XRE-type DNA-binding protein
MSSTKKQGNGYKKKIKDALMTQKKLAEITGINQVRISVVLNSSTEHFTPEEIEKIADALGITIN